MKKQGRSKAFWVTVTSVGVVGALGLATLIAWPGILKPALEKYQLNQELRYLDGVATTPAEIDPSVRATQNWLDGYTREFMKGFADTDNVGISVMNDYYAYPCDSNEQENCISPQVFYDYYTDDMDKNREAVVDYFLNLGLTPTNYVPRFELTQELLLEENPELGIESEDFEEKLDDKTDELMEVVENGNYENLDDFTMVTWCITSKEQEKKLYGADYEEIVKKAVTEGYELDDTPCLRPGITVISEPGRVSFTTLLGAMNDYSPVSLPQIEGRNYTRGEVEKATEGLNSNLYVCTDKPSLVHPYWLKWPDDEVKCVDVNSLDY